MQKGFTAILLLIIFACSSNPKATPNNEIKHIVKRAELVNWDAIPKAYELQFYNVNSFLDASGMMYENYGEFHERMVSKYQNYTDRVVWRDVKLFEDRDQTFTVITDGVHTIHPGFACIMVFDEKGRDCLKSSHPLKKDLILLFEDKIKTVSKNSVHHFRMESNTGEDYSINLHEVRGTLDEIEYETILKKFQKELDSSIIRDSPVLIQFKQDAPHCYSGDTITYNNKLLIKEEVRILNRISRTNKVQNYFVYDSKSPFAELFMDLDDYTLDSGYFYRNIFTQHENCSAFLLIKPDGRFVKYYGEGFYSIISDFLKE